MNYHMNQKGFTNIVLIIVIVAIVAVGGYFVFVKKSEPVVQQQTPTPPPTISSTTEQPAPTISFIGKWNVVSVEENGVMIVSDGNGATIEFSKNGTYQALGGCNQMMTRSYKTYPDSKLSVSVGGTKRSCAKNIVEFWDLGSVYSYEFNNDTLLLHYKAGTDTGTFKFRKISTN